MPHDRQAAPLVGAGVAQHAAYLVEADGVFKIGRRNVFGAQGVARHQDGGGDVAFVCAVVWRHGLLLSFFTFVVNDPPCGGFAFLFWGGRLAFRRREKLFSHRCPCRFWQGADTGAMPPPFCSKQAGPRLSLFGGFCVVSKVLQRGRRMLCIAAISARCHPSHFGKKLCAS